MQFTEACLGCCGPEGGLPSHLLVLLFFLSVVITVVSIYFSVLASKAVAGGGDGLQRAIKRAVS